MGSERVPKAQSEKVRKSTEKQHTVPKPQEGFYEGPFDEISEENVEAWAYSFDKSEGNALPENKTKEKPKPANPEKVKKVADLKVLIDYLNKARQSHEEITKVYRYVIRDPKGSDIKGEFPSFLKQRPRLRDRFGIKVEHEQRDDIEQFSGERDAAHALVEYLVKDAEQKIHKLERASAKKEKPAKKKPENKSKEGGGEEVKKGPEPEEETGTSEEEPDGAPEPETVAPGEEGEPEEPKEPQSEEDNGEKGEEGDDGKTIESNGVPAEKLNEARALYLKALRLRGNVFRGALGRPFGRTLEFEGEKLDFGGPLDLERVRHNYENELAKMRKHHIEDFVKSLDPNDKTLTPNDLREKTLTQLVNFMKAEQDEIDKAATEGIEKNVLEKLKTAWRKASKLRLVGGVVLAAGSALTWGTLTGAVLTGTRAIVGGAGVYTGVEAGLERYSRLLGHKGLVDQIAKETKGNEQEIRKYISTLNANELRSEVARLRMLQVEKGINIERAGRLGDRTAIIVHLLVEADHRNTAKEIAKLPVELSKEEKFEDIISKRLREEEEARNKMWEDETDREHVKKLGRKTIAAAAGVGTGWLIGGKLFAGGEAVPEAQPAPEATPGFTPIPGVTFGEAQLDGEPFGLEQAPTEPLHIEAVSPDAVATPEPPPAVSPTANEVFTHIISPEIVSDLSAEVHSGDSLWKLIEHNLSDDGLLRGFGEGQRTYIIDRMKDIFAEMTPRELHEVGIESGDIDLLRVGETVDLSPALGNPSFVGQVLEEARNLSTEALQSIKDNNEIIRQWLHAHPGEFLSSEKVADILAGRA